MMLRRRERESLSGRRGWFTGCALMNAVFPYLFVRVVYVKKRQVVSIDMCELGFRFVSPCNCPRTGLGRPNFLSDSSLAMRIDPIGGFARTVGSGGVTSLETCQLSPAWAALTALVGKEDSDRTDLEKKVAVALEWVGQAAAAPLTPVRLVSLVTALEVLVIDRHESLGKRSKLSHRFGRIVSVT